MFGISDPGIWLAYLLEVLCLLFAAWYGIRYWNQDDETHSDKDSTKSNSSRIHNKKAN